MSISMPLLKNSHPMYYNNSRAAFWSPSSVWSFHFARVSFIGPKTWKSHGTSQDYRGCSHSSHSKFSRSFCMTHANFLPLQMIRDDAHTSMQNTQFSRSFVHCDLHICRQQLVNMFNIVFHCRSWWFYHPLIILSICIVIIFGQLATFCDGLA